MRQSSLILALATAAPALAAPLDKKANFDPLPGGDVDILNYALTLEYLERKFYQEGVANYTAEDFCDAGFGTDVYTKLKSIAADEASHVSLLSTALGGKAVHEATYSFPSTDAASFLTLASVLEGVGVSAYLGAAGAIADKATYLPVAGSILAVEARHSSYIRAVLGENPTAKPYDTPLDFMTVYSLAAQFITGFAPGDPALPIKAFPKLTVMPSMSPTVIAGKTSITFPGAAAAAMSAGLVQSGQTVYAVFYSGLDTYYAAVTADGDDYNLAAIPTGDASANQLPPSGQVYVVLSTADGKTKASDENTISGVGILEVKNQ